MYKKIEEYKMLTLKMIDTIDSEINYNDKIASLLDDRQQILDSLVTNEELMEFRVLYKKLNIEEIDNILREALTKELNQAKVDILEQKKKRTANFAYSKINREGFNLFSTQI